MFSQKPLINQRGAAHFLALLVAVTTIGLVSFLILSTIGPIKSPLGNLYPKQQSMAAEDGAKQETTTMLESAQKFQRGDKTTLNQMLASSNQRKQYLKTLIKDHPEIFLQIAMPQKLSDSLPTEVQPDFEQETSAQGTFYLSHGDDIVHNAAVYDYSLIQNDGKNLKLHFAKNAPKLISGTRIKINGTRLDDDVAIDSALDQNSFQVLQASPAQTTNVLGTQATKKMAVIMVNLTDTPAANFGANDVRNALFNQPLSANNYYAATSNGRVTFSGRDNASGDVYGFYNIAVSSATVCQGTSTALNTLGNAAEAAAVSNGVNMTGYDEVIYWFPFVANCGFAGFSFVGPGPKGHGQSAMNGYYFTAQWGTQEYSIVTHELGHYLGVDHAGAFDCTNGTTRVALSPTCTHIEYGDPFDNMGNHDGNDNSFDTVTNLYHQGHNFHRLVWNFNTASNVQTISSTGSYTLTPVETGTGINTLKIARGSNQAFYLEFRQPNSNFDNFLSTDPVVNGVSIRVVPNSTNGIVKTDLIDTTPNTPSYKDSSLRVGQTFTDSDNNISITTQSVSSSGATVQVTLPATLCTRVNPTVLINPLSQFGTAGSSLNYNLQITNNDSASCGTEQFTITPTLPATGWIQLPVNQTASVAAGTTASQTFTLISPANAAANFYTFNETVTNSQATSFTSQASANYNINAVPTPTPSPTSTPAASKTPSPTPTPTSTPSGLTGDLDNDGDVDIFDYSTLVTNFGKTGTNVVGDLDHDGDVDIFDYSNLVTNFGKTS